MHRRLNPPVTFSRLSRPPLLVMIVGLMLFIGAGFALTASSAGAQMTADSDPTAAVTACVTAAIPLQPTEIDSDLTVAKFDSSLGTLLEVTVPSRIIHLDTHAAFENTAQTPVVFAATMNYQAIFTAPAALGASNTIVGSVARVPSQTLSAFDGTMDFSGASSVSQTPTAWDVTAAPFASTEVSVLEEFSGAGSVAFGMATVIGETFTGGGGNVQASITTSASAAVEVCYRFAPPVIPTAPPEIVPPSTPTEIVPAAAPSLPRTGAAAGPLLATALGALVVGGLLMVGARRPQLV